MTMSQQLFERHAREDSTSAALIGWVVQSQMVPLIQKTRLQKSECLKIPDVCRPYDILCDTSERS